VAAPIDVTERCGWHGQPLRPPLETTDAAGRESVRSVKKCADTIHTTVQDKQKFTYFQDAKIRKLRQEAPDRKFSLLAEVLKRR
jgi:uncharacterized protein (DUF1684 family)